MAIVTRKQISDLNDCLIVAEPSDGTGSDRDTWNSAVEALRSLERESKKSHNGDVILVTSTS